MQRPLRADARDNRARIMTAADEIFGAGGENASTGDVAKLAGVGIATVFRHFPTKRDLLHAVFTARIESLRDQARDLLSAPDAGTAFRTFVTETVTSAPTKLAIAEALIATEPSSLRGARDSGHLAGEQLREAFRRLLERAKAAGAVRSDVEAPEAYALMIGASRANAVMHLDDAIRDRMLALIFDGLAQRAR